MGIRKVTSRKISNAQTVMLCDTCKRSIASVRDLEPGFCNGSEPLLFAYAEGEETWRGAHHIKNGSFLSAVKERCYICYTLHQACPREAREYANFFLTFYEIRPQGDDSYSLHFAIELRQDPPRVTAVSQVIEPYGTFKILPKKVVPSAGACLRLTANTFTGKCGYQIQDWLKECAGTHESCNEDWRTQVVYPFRLLNVKLELRSQVRLEEFKSGSRPARYVTMSHCWGHGQNTLRLTEGNIEDLKKCCSISELPQKIRDAIMIARWMEVEYLWIDALCIIQDSIPDWQEQSSIMGNIYAGSYCNIAVTNMGDDEGCFTDRPVEIVEPYFVSDPMSSSTIEKTHMIGYDDIWCNSLLDTALHTRAWVLQERLLSPRTIHFGKEQMFWECREHKACEAYPSGVPPEFCNRRTNAWRQGETLFKPKSRKSFFANPLEFFFPAKPARVVFDQAYKFWSTTVERYMECDLSVASDKLVAIAGIANKVQETTGEQYLAGLWENSCLPQSLLWYVPFREQADGRGSVRSPSLGEPDYRAPSWSWASLDAKIVWNFPTKCDQVLIEVERTDIKVLRGDVGAIESARMKLQGRLIAVQLRILHKNEDRTPKEDGSYALIPKQEQESLDGHDPLAKLQPDEEPIVYLDTALSPAPARDVYLLPICTKWQDGHGSVNGAIAGLIVKKSEVAEEVVYERMGVFCLDDSQARIIGSCGGNENGGMADMGQMQSVILV